MEVIRTSSLFSTIKNILVFQKQSNKTICSQIKSYHCRQNDYVGHLTKRLSE